MGQKTKGKNLRSASVMARRRSPETDPRRSRRNVVKGVAAAASGPVQTKGRIQNHFVRLGCPVLLPAHGKRVNT